MSQLAMFCEVEKGGFDMKAYQKAYQQTPEYKAYKKAYNQTPEVKAYQKAYRETPEAKASLKARQQTPEVKAKEKARQQTPEVKAYQKAYRETPEVKAALKARQQTPERKAALKARKKERMRTDDNYRMRCLITSRTTTAITKQKGTKSKRTLELLGSSIEFVRQHLASQFTEGMTWKNQGKWHIDHIYPCCKFDLRKKEEQEKCFHYSNLQPLWATDNISKGGRI